GQLGPVRSGDPRPVLGQLGGLQVPAPGPGGQPVRRQLNVAGGPERRPDMSLIWRFVVTKTDITVRPEDFRLAELGRQLFEQLLHRRSTCSWYTAFRLVQYSLELSSSRPA